MEKSQSVDFVGANMAVDEKLRGTNRIREPVDGAVLHVIEALKANAEDLRAARTRIAELDARFSNLCSVARSYLKDMAEDDRADFLKAYPILTPGPASAPRGVFLAAIIDIFLSDQKRTWATPDIQSELDRKGIHTESKRIFNTLNYLAADGRLERLGRGQYRAAARLSRGAIDRTEAAVE